MHAFSGDARVTQAACNKNGHATQPVCLRPARAAPHPRINDFKPNLSEPVRLTQSESKNTVYFTGKYSNGKTAGKELKYVRNPEKTGGLTAMV